MSFFKNYPPRQLTLDNTNETVNVKDIFRHVDVDDLAIDPFSTYTYYDIGSADRPDIVSQKLYGTTDFYWTFFILNDYLKEGIGAWPKSEQELERYITEQYDKYSVLQFLPGPFNEITGLSTFGDSAYYNNSFAGLDLSHDYLRIRRDDINNGYALIDYFDPNLFQLFVYKVSNANNFFNSTGDFIIETYNPFLAQNPMYETIQQSNDAWLEKALLWAQEGYASTFERFLIENTDLITLSRRQYLRRFEDYFLKSGRLGWQENTIFEKGRNAHVAYSNPSTGEPITAFDAYRGAHTTESGETSYGSSGSLGIQTRYELEVEKNFAKRKMRVIKKSQINAFVEEYKKKLV